MPTIIQQIESVLKSNNSFVLSGGAGSGKTHSLQEIINSIYRKEPKAKIACITFTEVASNEIAERCKTSDRDLWVSTIHKFLWENIKNYKSQLKKELIELIKAAKISYREEVDIEEALKDKIIDYGISKKISELKSMSFKKDKRKEKKKKKKKKDDYKIYGIPPSKWKLQMF